MAVPPIPEGYNSLSPYLVVEGADQLVAFLQQTFGAEVLRQMTRPDGKIGHAEIRVGDSIVMLADAAPAAPMLHVYVDDVDAAYARALAAGATSIRVPEDQFYGDRSAGVVDAFGNQWWLATHTEDVAEDELARRAAAVNEALNKE